MHYKHNSCSVIPAADATCAARKRKLLPRPIFKRNADLVYTPPQLEFDYLGNPREKNLQEPCGLTYQQLGEFSDEQVMAHLSAGHGDAAAVLFDRYSRLVHSIASKIVREHGEAEDVTQEIFVELCKTAAQCDASKGTAKMWIIRLAYRRSLNRRRHLNFRNSHLLQDMGELENTPNAEFVEVQAMTSHESRRLVRQMLASLDAGQRRILELVYFEGLSMRDVADRTGDSFDSVRHRYYRGMRKLREQMQQPSDQKVVTSAAQEALNAKT